MISSARTDVSSPLRTLGRGLFLAATITALAATDTSCRVFAQVEDCNADADCGPIETCHPTGKFCQKLTSVKVGLSLPITGPLASVGSGARDAAEYATAVLNANGGVLGLPVALEIVDDEGQDNLAESAAKTLVERGVVGIVGPLRSSQVLKAQAITYAAKVVEITPFAGADALGASQPASDRYLFQTITSIRKGSSSAIVRFATKPAGEPARDDPKCESMAVLHTDDVTGNEYAQALASLMALHGACVTYDAPFPPALKADYIAEVRGMIAKKPDCAAIIALPPVGAAILREFDKQTANDREAFADFRFFGTSTLHSADFLTGTRVDKAKATPSYAEGVTGADVDSAPPRAEYDDFAFGWKEHFQTDAAPPNLAANAFDALILLALALEQAGSVHDRKAIRDAIYTVSRDGDRVPAFGPGTLADALRAVRRHERINYQGASGGIELDDRGVVANATVIWKVEQGAFTTALRYTEEQTGAVDDPKATPRSCPIP